MNQYDHMRLIKPVIVPKRQIWADFGSGDGAFTLALAELGGEETEIYSIDQDEGRLATQKKKFQQMSPHTNIHFIHQDFTKPMDMPVLDGIVMANSLHFVEKQIPFLINLKDNLKPSGKLVIVEYNSENGNMWVPYPISFRALEKLCKEAGFLAPQKIGTHPSDFLKEIYSAVTGRK